MKRTLFAVFIGHLPLISFAATLPSTTLTVHDVQFSDPRGNADTVGGNAYDRQTNEIGVNRSQTNQALATITPARVAGLVQFIPTDGTIASVAPSPATRSPETLTVSGIARGNTVIIPRRRPARQLGVYVHTPFQRTVAFYIVNDNAGHNAGLTLAQAQAAVQAANNFWSTQANTTFPTAVNPQVSVLSVPQDLGPTFDIAGVIGPEEQAVVNATPNTGASFNVYFVNQVVVAGRGPVEGATRAATGNVFVSVSSADLNRTVAHELGHALGLSAASGNADYTDAARLYHLMYGEAGGGFTITPRQVLIINPPPIP